MSLSEDRVLVSVEINLKAGGINVLWLHRIIRDGNVISETPHRGAYPTDENGNPDESVVSEMGKSVAEIIGEGFSNSQQRLMRLEAENVVLKNQIAALKGQ